MTKAGTRKFLTGQCWYQMKEIKNEVWNIWICNFEIVSDFGFRASDLAVFKEQKLTKKVFTQEHENKSPSLNPSHQGRESPLAPCGRGLGWGVFPG